MPHLTDRYDQPKFEYLKKIISPAEVVILNGDFFDSYVADFDKIAHTWQNLFKLLKTKETYYLFGNHDARQARADYGLFSKYQLDELEFTQNGQKFHVEHGDDLAPYMDSMYHHLPRFALSIAAQLDAFLTRTFGERFLKPYQSDNKRMKIRQKAHLSADTFLICGHSHWAEFSPQQKYANSGMFNVGLAQFLTIENGKIELHKEQY